MTDDEILTHWTGSVETDRPVMGSKKVLAFARAILAAHTAKLLAGVEMPEPVGRTMRFMGHDEYARKHSYCARTYDELPKGMYSDTWRDLEQLFTQDQLQQYAAAAADRAKLLEGVEMPMPELLNGVIVNDDKCKLQDGYTKDQLQQYAAAAAAQARVKALDEAKGCNEADELLRNLHLDPERYRTEGGAINHLKVRAAILNPRDYCDHEWVTAPASLGGQLCSKCGRMK